jgi:hypothetical protein
MKTKIQKEKIKSVISKDATGLGALLRDGDMCVVGGLLHAAGYSDDTILYHQSAHGGSVSSLEKLPGALETLEHKFGLKEFHLRELMAMNDAYYRTHDRRRALIKLVDKLK